MSFYQNVTASTLLDGNSSLGPVRIMMMMETAINIENLETTVILSFQLKYIKNS